MSSQGPLFPTAIDEVDDNIGGVEPTHVAWTNPNNFRGTPGEPSAATVELANAVSKTLVGKPAGLGFNIPFGARIDGLEMIVNCKTFLNS